MEKGVIDAMVPFGKTRSYMNLQPYNCPVAPRSQARRIELLEFSPVLLCVIVPASLRFWSNCKTSTRRRRKRLYGAVLTIGDGSHAIDALAGSLCHMGQY